MKRRGAKLLLYVRIVAMNAAVAAMLFMVNVRLPIPTVAAAAPVVRLTPRLIPTTTGVPKRLVIPSLHMDLRVATGSFDPKTGTWEIDATKAYYADSSLPANDSNGTTLIYGHAQAPVFARLPELHRGAKLTVYTTNGYAFHYTYRKMTQVLPTDTSVFTVDGPPVMVLQTCTGDWDAYRALFHFSFDSVEKG